MRTEHAGRKLPPRREAFAAEYLKDLNATRAAIRAGYSAKTASSIGARLLADAGVARAVEAGMAARARRTEIDADRVVLELARIAFADPRDLMEWGPDGVALKESSSLTEEQAAGVAEVAEGSGGTLRLKKHDKVRALELLGKHLGLFRDRAGTDDDAGTPGTRREVTPVVAGLLERLGRGGAA